MSDATSDNSETLSDGNSPSDRGKSEVWIDMDNGNFYFWFVKSNGERVAEPWLSDMVTIPASFPTNTAIFEIEVEGAEDDNGEAWLAARAMLKRVRQRLGIAMPKPERVTYQAYRPALEHMMRVEPNAEVRTWLESLLDLSYEEEREDVLKRMPTANPTSAPPSVEPPVERPPKQEPPRQKTRGEIVQEYADKVLAGEV